MISKPLITVVETPTFLRQANRLMADSTREKIIDAIAKNPELGEFIVGTGGARKWRYARPGSGKSGGFRVIHFYHDDTVPAFALGVFAKSDKINLTQAERNQMKKNLSDLVETYKQGARK